MPAEAWLSLAVIGATLALLVSGRVAPAVAVLSGNVAGTAYGDLALQVPDASLVRRDPGRCSASTARASRCAPSSGACSSTVGDMLLLLSDDGFRERWRDRPDFLLIAHRGGLAPTSTAQAWLVGPWR